MKKIMQYLIIANLVLLLIYLINLFPIVHSFINVMVWVVIMPIVFGVFIFYILRPLNRMIIKIGIKEKWSILLTLLISIVIAGVLLRFFGIYLLDQIEQVKVMIFEVMNTNEIIYLTDKYWNLNSIEAMVINYSKEIFGYVRNLILNIEVIFDKGMMIFSNILLILLITFFLLKDGCKFKLSVLRFIPPKYKDVGNEILSEGDKLLSSYIIGQATVALSLSIIVFIGYKIIKLPSALVFSLITFVLAFIPFVGFLISMIVPYIIAITMGLPMIIKLTVVFIVAQTLKGRVVVPFIMGKVMKIHPLTDIFLVVGAATIFGPLGAFCVIPVYTLLKSSIKIVRDHGYLSVIDKIYKV